MDLIKKINPHQSHHGVDLTKILNPHHGVIGVDLRSPKNKIKLFNRLFIFYMNMTGVFKTC